MKMKKVVLSAACAAALVVGTVAGTMAYLTDKTEVVNNTFTVGKVDITLDEVKTDVYGDVDTTATSRVTANQYKLIPGRDYTKDPTVHVSSDSETSWLFVKVTNGIEDIEAAGDTTIAKQMEINGWAPVAGQTDVYAYESQVNAGQEILVFGSFELADNAEVAGFGNANITITAYAVQADGFDTAADAWAGAPATW